MRWIVVGLVAQLRGPERHPCGKRNLHALATIKQNVKQQNKRTKKTNEEQLATLRMRNVQHASLIRHGLAKINTQMIRRRPHAPTTQPIA